MLFSDKSRVFCRKIALLLLTAGLSAQNELPRITGIVVEGNKVTKEHIIIREISHPLNQAFDSTLAREDRNRLYNLGIFELVEVYPQVTEPGEAALVVEVVESIRMVPIPIFYHLEQLGWSYGGGVSYLNFRGLNQRLNLTATYGAEKTYTIMFSDPWLFGDRISVTGWMLHMFRRHPVDSIRIEIQDVELGAGRSSADKRLSVFGAVSLERRIVHPQGRLPDIPGNPTPDTPHRVFQSKFSLIWRTTDIWRDPTRGYRLSFGLTPVIGLDDHSPSYIRVGLGGAWFYPLRSSDRPLVFGIGSSISHYDKAPSPFLKQYLGGYWVRGYHVDPDQNASEVRTYLKATSVVAASAELRQTLIPRRLFGRLEMGLSGVLFADVGWGYGPERSITAARPITGYGAGLRFFLPIIQIIALDVGLNPYDTKLRPRFQVEQSF